MAQLGRNDCLGKRGRWKDFLYSGSQPHILMWTRLAVVALIQVCSPFLKRLSQLSMRPYWGGAAILDL